MIRWAPRRPIDKVLVDATRKRAGAWWREKASLGGVSAGVNVPAVVPKLRPWQLYWEAVAGTGSVP
ncbi:MAG: hypothetical protein ACRD2X_08060 [Vicinamibacteraceae bacterium]